MGDVLPPKRQAVVDRLRRRIESYRRRQSDCIPRFDQSFNGLCEQNIQETLALKQRFLETKTKRAAKKTEKKQESGNNIHTKCWSRPHEFAGRSSGLLERGAAPVLEQQKFLKRTAEELDAPGASTDAYEPPPKMQCTAATSTSTPAPESLTKFSVEIVQQLEFTTSAANVQPQQISTNVTVKALTNASVKTDAASPKSPAPRAPAMDIGTLVECKQEPDSEFVDLEQCAAALEKDAAANGATFPGLSDLIGDDTNDEIITSDAFKDLISEISDFALLKDLDLEEEKPSPFSPYSSLDFSKAELSPAAQTLKQMAEQHQHKTQLGMSFAGVRSPYADFQFPADYTPSYLSKPDVVKQEAMQRQYGGSKQQYSPYGSPNHGSPQYVPRGPPRPPSCPGAASLQINQAQQLQISQPGQQVQVTAGQHLQMTGDLKPGVSVAAQQGMYYNQPQAGSQTVPASESYSVSQSQTINFTQQSLRQRPGPRAMVDTPGSLLQQQILRMQQQQQQHLCPRPPPPEYKASMMGPQQRFSGANLRRVGQQPMPPSGPMMRPQQAALHGGGGSMYLQHHLPAQHRAVGSYNVRAPQQRSPNVSVGPDGLGVGGRTGPEWRHLVMSQQQSAVFNRPAFPQGSFPQGALPMVRNSSVGQMQMMSQQQSLTMQPSGPGAQMPMSLQMSQSISVNSGHVQQQVGYSGSPGGVGGNNPQSAPPTTVASQAPPDFSLEFLEHLPPGDSSHFSAAAQELLNSLDSTSSFNLQDILQ